jgi:hypothetical protein
VCRGVQREFGRAYRLVPPAGRELQHRKFEVHVGEVEEVLGAVGEVHAGDEVPLGLGEPGVVEEVPDDVDVRAAGVLELLGGECHPQALHERRLAARIPAGPLHEADVVQRV